MMTGDIKSKIDAVWNAFWAGGIANPLEVIEQITYLLFLRRLDDRARFDGAFLALRITLHRCDATWT
jgi:type I restriction enzyme M protein